MRLPYAVEFMAAADRNEEPAGFEMWVRGRLCRIEAEVHPADRSVGIWAPFVEAFVITPLDDGPPMLSNCGVAQGPCPGNINCTRCGESLPSDVAGLDRTGMALCLECEAQEDNPLELEETITPGEARDISAAYWDADPPEDPWYPVWRNAHGQEDDYRVWGDDWHGRNM